MQVIATDRLVLRPFTMEDLDAFHVVLTHPDVWRYDLHRQLSYTETQELLTFRVLEFRKHGCGQWAIILKATQQLIGYCGLQLCLAPTCSEANQPEIELIYGLHPATWGQGLATEAGKRMIHFGFEELKLTRIVSGAERENIRSIQVMRRVGMRIEECTPDADMVLGIIENGTESS